MYDQCEPLSLPAPCWLLPGQVTSLLVSLVTLGLCLSISVLDTAYSVITGVTAVQQTFQVLLTYTISTDIGFCCPGVSYTRWFLHQDFYTKVTTYLLNL